MDVFNDEFQEYISYKMGVACESIEDKEKWKEINNRYDILHSDIFKSLNEGQQEKFNTFLNTLWEKVKVEQCIVYKMGIADKEDLKRYELLNGKRKEANNE